MSNLMIFPFNGRIIKFYGRISGIYGRIQPFMSESRFLWANPKKAVNF